MADYRVSIRRRSPISEASPDHSEGVAGAEIQSAPVISRTRPVPTKTATDETSQQSTSSIWVDTDRGDNSKAKGGQATPRKVSKISSRNTASLDSSPVDREKETVGFFPKLSRILEGRESKPTRRRRDSTISSREDDTPARRRHRPIEDATLSRRSARQKHGSLQRRVESLSNLPNPSLVSVLSGLTHVSGASSESNSTITQQSYDKVHMVKRKPPTERKRPQAKSPVGEFDAMDHRQASVFQHMNHGLDSEHLLAGQCDSRPSTASSASFAEADSTDDDDGHSSVGEGLAVESPLTSPASMRRPGYSESHEGTESDLDISVREATPELAHQPSVSDDVEEHEVHQRRVDIDEDDESSEEEYDGQEDPAAGGPVEHSQHLAHHMALERVPPPRLPSSSSSRRSDRHSRRLRRQEKALSDHVLQPQPHRDFQFVGGPSPHPNHAVPLYSPYMHSGASPSNFHAIAPNTLPPAPPPPPRMDYHSPSHGPPVPYSTGYDGHFAMVPRPPMAAPSVVGPPPVYPYPPAHPPQYQPQPAGPLAKATVTGYELLADKLSEGSRGARYGPEETIVPMYRKFEHLHHRVLLHIQDEIAEMEEDLRYLDESITQCSPRDEAGRVLPASRRSETRYGSELHYRRTELLGRIYLKLGQYNSALSSFSDMHKDMAAAESEDVRAYRTWIEQRTPIDYAETRFLEREDDLLAVSRKRSASSGSGVSSHQSAAIWLPMILAMPLMAFAIVPGLLGRLFILCLIGAAITKLLTSTEELKELMTEREWCGCFSVYFGVMALLAALAR